MSQHQHVARKLQAPKDALALLSSSPETSTAIVFVHGFAGHAVKTWNQFHRLIDGIVGQDGGVDPLQDAIGVTTGDLAHRLLYWRLPFGDQAFRASFLEALGWSGKLLYRHGVVGHGDSGEGSDDSFAEALVDRVGRVATIWSRAFIAAYATAGSSDDDQAGAAAAG